MEEENRTKLIELLPSLLHGFPYKPEKDGGPKNQPEDDLLGTLIGYLYQPVLLEETLEQKIVWAASTAFNLEPDKPESVEHNWPITHRIRNIAAASIFTQPKAITFLVLMWKDSLMPRGPIPAFWHGLVVGALRGLVERMVIELNAYEIKQVAEVLCCSLISYPAEASKYYGAHCIPEIPSGALEQELSKTFARLTEMGGMQYFTEPLTCYFKGTEKGLAQQVAKQAFLKAFARGTLMQLCTGFRERNNRSTFASLAIPSPQSQVPTPALA